MDWNELNNKVRNIKNKASREIYKNLLPKIKESKHFDKKTGYIYFDNTAILLEDGTTYTDGVNEEGYLHLHDNYEVEIFDIDVYDVIYIGDLLDTLLKDK